MSKSEALMAIQLMKLEQEILCNTKGFMNSRWMGDRCDWLDMLIVEMQWNHCICGITGW